MPTIETEKVSQRFLLKVTTNWKIWLERSRNLQRRIISSTLRISSDRSMLQKYVLTLICRTDINFWTRKLRASSSRESRSLFSEKQWLQKLSTLTIKVSSSYSPIMCLRRGITLMQPPVFLFRSERTPTLLRPNFRTSMRWVLEVDI